MQKINAGLGNRHASQVKIQKNKGEVKFKGTEATLKNEVSAFMQKKTGWWLARVFAKHEGEVQTQLGNAAFTTTLAPIMIAFNPFSDQETKTKKYTAWRQPLSALIAIGIGWPLTSSYEKWLKKIAMNGDINAIDLRIMKPDSEYKKAFKEYLKSNNDNTKYSTLDKFAENENNKMVANFAEKYIYSDYDETINTAKADLKSKKINEQEYKKLVQTLDTHNLNKKTLPDFMENEFKFKFIKKEDSKHINEDTYGKKIKEIKAVDFLQKLGLVSEKFEEESLRVFLLEKKQMARALSKAELRGVKAGSEEFNKILNEIKAEGKITSRNIEFNLGPQKGNKISLGQLLEAFEMDKSFMGDLDADQVEEITESLKKQEVQNIKDLFLTKESNSMKSALIKLKEKLKGLKEIDPNDSKKTIEIAGKDFKELAIQIAKNTGEKALKDFKNIKNYTSIGFNLVLTAISCTLLNWAYPRMMELFFPHLCKKDGNGGQK